MAIINGIATVVALLTFLGIVWWAFSSGRSQANREASLLPFAAPDEHLDSASNRSSHE